MTLFSRPRQNNTFKFPAIPPPGNTPEEMMACIRALKEAVELLSGAVGNNRALVTADLYGNTTSGENNFSTPGGVADIEGYGLLDQANEQFREIFDSELVALEAEIANDISDVQTELTTALTELETGTNDQFTVIDGRLDVVEATSASNTASIATEIVTRANADSALAASISTVSTQASDNASAITAETLSRTNADNALTLQISSATSLAGAKGKVFVQSSAPTSTGSYTLATNDLWIDTLHGNLLKYWTGSAWVAVEDTRIGVAIADISSEAFTRAAADSALTSSVNTAVSRIDGIQGSLTEAEITTVGNLGALVATTETLQANIDDGDAFIQGQLDTESATRASETSALSGQVTTAQATANDATASSHMRLLSTAATTGDAASEFAVQVRANTSSSYAAAGLRLQALSNGQSRVIVEGGSFAVYTSGGPVIPFTIVGSTVYWGGELVVGSVGTDELGTQAVTTSKIATGAVGNGKLAANAVTKDKILAGEIDATVIADGAITTNKIFAGAVTAAKIGAGQVTADAMAANSITAANGAIAALAVQSLNLAGQAVTVPTVQRDTGEVSFTGVSAGTVSTVTFDVDTTGLSGVTIPIIAWWNGSHTAIDGCDYIMNIQSAEVSRTTVFRPTGASAANVNLVGSANITGTGGNVSVTVQVQGVRVNGGVGTVTFSTRQRTLIAMAAKR